MADNSASGGSTAPVVLIPSGTGRDAAVSSPGAVKKQHPFQKHYNDLLAIISEVGKDVKPAYTSNKISTDKLRKNIMAARGYLRECQADLEKLGAQE